jgi:hypothetical protein
MIKSLLFTVLLVCSQAVANDPTETIANHLVAKHEAKRYQQAYLYVSSLDHQFTSAWETAVLSGFKMFYSCHFVEGACVGNSGYYSADSGKRLTNEEVAVFKPIDDQQEAKLQKKSDAEDFNPSGP